MQKSGVRSLPSLSVRIDLGPESRIGPGKIQLLDARAVWTAGGSEDNKRSLGDKRRHITGAQIAEIVKLYGRQSDGETSKIFDNADFGYTRVTVERPLRLRYQMTRHVSSTPARTCSTTCRPSTRRWAVSRSATGTRCGAASRT